MLSTSTIITLVVAAIVLIVVLRILTGLLRIGIAVAILGFAGYWLYTHVPGLQNLISTFPK